MIIEKNSPLKTIPAALDMKVALPLDAVCFSVEMCEASFNRLHNTMLTLSLTCDSGNYSSKDHEDAISLLFSDAWSVINATNTIRELVNYIMKTNGQLPCGYNGPSKITDVFSISSISPLNFVFNTKEVSFLRNCSQHIKGRLEHIFSVQKTVWGSLKWMFIKNVDQKDTFTLFHIVSGSYNTVSETLLYPYDRKMHSPIGMVTLSAYGVDVCLSELMMLITLLVRNMEKQLRPQFEVHKEKMAREFLFWIKPVEDDQF